MISRLGSGQGDRVLSTVTCIFDDPFGGGKKTEFNQALKVQIVGIKVPYSLHLGRHSQQASRF